MAKKTKKKTTKKAGAKRVSKKPASRPDASVSDHIAALKHPMKQELEAVRSLILAVSPNIREEIKWNSPSFRIKDFFATVNLHTKDSLRLILHRGAKSKDNATVMKIADPAGLLQWLSKDRCLVTLTAGPDLKAKLAALKPVVKQWIGQL